MKELCTLCLSSTSGYCGLHAALDHSTDNKVTFTSTTYSGRKYTKKEVLEELLYWLSAFLSLKWYEFDKKKYYKRKMVEWLDFYKSFK